MERQPCNDVSTKRTISKHLLVQRPQTNVADQEEPCRIRIHFRKDVRVLSRKPKKPLLFKKYRFLLVAKNRGNFPDLASPLVSWLLAQIFLLKNNVYKVREKDWCQPRESINQLSQILSLNPDLTPVFVHYGAMQKPSIDKLGLSHSCLHGFCQHPFDTEEMLLWKNSCILGLVHCVPGIGSCWTYFCALATDMDSK